MDAILRAVNKILRLTINILAIMFLVAGIFVPSLVSWCAAAEFEIQRAVARLQIKWFGPRPTAGDMPH
jgi:hypothetical protein